MARVVTNEVLFNIFVGTLSVEKSTREAAEQALGELSMQHQDLVLSLLRFCCEPIPSADGSPVPFLSASHRAAADSAQTQQRNVLLAAAIRVRNVLGRSDWGRNSYFTEAVKLEVRQVIVPLQCQPHVAEHIRRQLLETVKELMMYDYPDKWPGLVPQLNNLLDGWVAALRSALNASDNQISSDQVASVVLQLKGGLGVLRACCKIYEDPLRADASDVDRFANMFLPSLVSLSELFLSLWREEVYRLSRGPQPLLDLPDMGNLFEFTPILTELSNCLRMILKCIWSLLSARMPKCLCNAASFQSFWTTCIAEPLAVFHAGYLPMCRARLQSQLHTPGAGTSVAGDHFPIFQESAMWKQLKWLYTIAYKLVQEFMEPKSCERRVRAIATAFRDAAMVPVAQYAIDLVRWHACPATESNGNIHTSDGSGGYPVDATGEGSPVLLLTSKAYIMAVEIVSSAASSAMAYDTVIHPAVEELMTGLLFPRLAFSTEDAELWASNPEEYVRKQSNPVGDLFNAKVVSAACLMSLAVPSEKFHDAMLLGSLVNFLMNQLQIFSPQAAQAVSEEQSGPAAMDAARRVDAALFCMFQFKKVLTHMQLGDEKLEFVLNRFVVPATRYPLGFLRARAVLVLSVFAPSIKWGSPQSYQAALQSVLPLLSDDETPVRVQTCVSFARLIRHPHAREVVTPCIVQLIQHYFDVMRLMDNEAVIRTLRRTIAYYHDSLSQWGLELADMLVAHFQTVLHSVSVRYRALETTGTSMSGNSNGPAMVECLEDDGFADVLMAADELLDTLTTLVKALPADGSDTPSNVFVQLQYRISPMLYVILSHQGGSTYGFMDPTLMLLTTLLSRSPRVVAPTWQLLPCLHQLVVRSGAVDYFGQMLAPLDNYITVSTESFLFVQLHLLCGVEPDTALAGAAGLMALTPLALAEDMAMTVLHRQDQLTGREIGAVPKLYDCLMQHLWMQRTAMMSSADGQREQELAASAGSVVTTATQQLVSYLQSESAHINAAAASTAARAGGVWEAGFPKKMSTRTATLRVLFSNSVLSCIIADAAAALQVMVSANALTHFYEQYMAAVMGSSSLATAGGTGSDGKPSRRNTIATTVGPGVLTYLRSYDRNVFVLSFCRAVQLLATPSAWTPTHDALRATLHAVVSSTLLEAFARTERETAEAELQILERRLVSLQRKQAKVQQQHPQQSGEEGALDAASDEWEDAEEWEDDSSFDDAGDDGDGDFDDDDNSAEAADDDDVDQDDEDADYSGNNALGFGSEDAAYFSHDRRLQAMLQRAQQLRGGGGGSGHQGSANRTGTAAGEEDEFEDVDDFADGEDDHDNDENLLDEEDEDFTSPVDTVNVWAVLLHEVIAPFANGQMAQPQQQQSVSLESLLVQQSASGVFASAQETVSRLFAARAAFAAFTSTH